MQPTHDALGRRRRLCTPRRTARAVKLDERDRLWFAAIARHGPLPASVLIEFGKQYRANENNMKQRLARLRAPTPDGPYLEVANSDELERFGMVGAPFFYRLGSAARRIVGPVSPKPRSVSPHHDRLVNVVSAYLEICLRGTRYEFMPHAEVVDLVGAQAWEHRGKRRVPDRLMGMQLGEKRRLHPIEVITYSQQQSATKGKKTIADMMAWYFSFVSNGTYQRVLKLGGAGMMPLFVFTSEARMQNAMQHVTPNSFMLYKHMPVDIIKNAEAMRHLFADGWRRRDHDAFFLSG